MDLHVYGASLGRLPGLSDRMAIQHCEPIRGEPMFAQLKPIACRIVRPYRR